MAQKILLVEDDVYIRKLYGEVLQDAGFQVDMAEDGILGLDKIKKGGYDLILLDVVMPKMDGLGVLERLEQNPPIQKNGPIILLSNLAKDPITQGDLGKGAAGYIVKSDVTPDQLIEDVRKYLK
jgi:two-component system chemotaxis response regulator CheY